MKEGELLSLIARHHQVSGNRIHLVPSENPLAIAARLPYLTEAASRYSFGPDPHNPAWPGNEDLAAIEASAVEGLRQLFGVQHVNLKPISGISCMAVALSALAERGTTLFSIGEFDGGHGSTRFIAQRLGLRPIELPYFPRRYAIDADQLAGQAAEVKGPIIVYLDQFMSLFPHDLVAIRRAVGPDAIIHYDGSHVLGLIAGGRFQDPISEGADSLGGSTHKSFPGPHKGVLLTNSDKIASEFDEHASHWVSHHHPADVAALALAVAEMQATGVSYAERTIVNAQRLANELAAQGFEVCAAEYGFTRSHQVWLDIAPVTEPTDASRALLAAGLVVNAIEVPYLSAGSGLRLGTQEVTRIGFDSDAMHELAMIFRRVLIDGESPERVAPTSNALLHRFAPNREHFETTLGSLVASMPDLVR